MNTVEIKSVPPAELSALLSRADSLELLDVRTPPEYARAHVPGASLVPLDELNVGAILANHRPGAPIYVLCHSGTRAAKAIKQFQKAGCEDCVLVDGGIQAWIDARLPVHRGHSAVLPIMRQVQIVVGSLVAIGSVLALAVNSWFALLPLFLGCGLLFAGITGLCGMALLLAKMPWNREQHTCAHCASQE